MGTKNVPILQIFLGMGLPETRADLGMQRIYREVPMRRMGTRAMQLREAPPLAVYSMDHDVAAARTPSLLKSEGPAYPRVKRIALLGGDRVHHSLSSMIMPEQDIAFTIMFIIASVH